MCGAFGFTSTNIFIERFEIKNKIEARKMYNIRPSMKALTVTKNSPNHAEYRTFGIKAPWKDTQLLINAKSETAATLRTFKTMFREQRCIIPADFFFEWKRNPDKTKTPYLFKRNIDKCFSFAGLYNNDGFVILTTRPSDLMKPIHNRMPCILRREDEEMWLNHDSEIDQLFECLAPYEIGMECYPVSSKVNSPKNQGDELIEKIKTPSKG